MLGSHLCLKRSKDIFLRFRAMESGAPRAPVRQIYSLLLQVSCLPAWVEEGLPAHRLREPEIQCLTKHFPSSTPFKRNQEGSGPSNRSGTDNNPGASFPKGMGQLSTLPTQYIDFQVTLQDLSRRPKPRWSSDMLTTWLPIPWPVSSVER